MIKQYPAIIFTLIIVFHLHLSSKDLSVLPWRITSDYGPRMIYKNEDGMLHWNFHGGIDYGTRYGDEIPSVESGEIIRLEYLKGGWNLRVKGLSGDWEYIHIFKGCGALPIISNDWELRNALLVKPETNNKKRANVIIMRHNKSVEKILSYIQGYFVYSPDTTYLLDKNGNPIKTRAYVERGETIAISGNSGERGTPPHLHLEYNDGSDNPLIHIKHPPDIIPTVSIESPPEGKVFTSEELKEDYPLRVKVDSRSSLDFDKLDMWVYKAKESNQAIHLLGREDENHTFSYGGRIKEDKTSTLVESDDTGTGVKPISLGEDRFVYLQNLGRLNLGKGAHLFVVKGKDINGNDIPEVKREFIVADISSEVAITSTREYYRVDEYYGVVDEYREDLDYPVSEWGQVFTGDVFCGGYGRYKSEIFPGICYDDAGRWFEVTNTYMEVSRYRIDVTTMTVWEFALLDCRGGNGVKYEGGPYDSIDDFPSDCQRQIMLDVDFRDKEEKLLGHYMGEIFSYAKRENLEVWKWDKETGGYDIFGGVITNPGFKPDEEGMKVRRVTVGELAKTAGIFERNLNDITNVGVTISSTVERAGRGPDMWASVGIRGIDFYQK